LAQTQQTVMDTVKARILTRHTLMVALVFLAQTQQTVMDTVKARMLTRHTLTVVVTQHTQLCMLTRAGRLP